MLPIVLFEADELSTADHNKSTPIAIYQRGIRYSCVSEEEADQT